MMCRKGTASHSALLQYRRRITSTPMRCPPVDAAKGRGQRSETMPTNMGKRYVCGTCGAEFMVTKGSTGELSCCGTPVQPK